MTIVAGAKFGDRIVICADTAISDEVEKGPMHLRRRPATGPTHLPGRLKAIVLSPTFSVAFAGAADRAHAAIVSARADLLREGPQAAIARLKQSSLRSSEDWDDSVDYLVAKHHPSAQLLKIANGTITKPLNRAWIGDSQAADALMRNIELAPARGSPAPWAEGELEFRWAFGELFRSHGTSISPGVGGSYFQLLASPYGHCYDGYISAQSTMVLFADIGRTEKHEESLRTGEADWRVGTVATRYRGVAVVGLIIPQSRHAYIFAPFLCDTPVSQRLLDSHLDWVPYEGSMQADLRHTLDRIAEQIGGGIVVD